LSLWVRVLVYIFVGTFTSLALVLAIRGEGKAAGGALVIAALISPALLEAWRPGKYLLRKPDDGSPDTLLNRMRQFRTDHPGIDGTLILALLTILGIAILAGSLFRLLRSLGWL